MKWTPRWRLSLWIAAGVVTVTGILAAAKLRRAPTLSEGEAIALRGDLRAIDGIDIRRLRQSLPLRLRTASRVMLYASDQVNCQYCAALPSSSNGTDVPAVFVTECTAPGDRPRANVTVVAPGGLDGLPPDVSSAEPVSLLIDFESDSVTVAPGNVPTWTDCLESFQRYAAYRKENL